MMKEIPADIKKKIESQDKEFASELLEELYTICRQTGRSCSDCSFEYEKLDFDLSEDEVIAMCPLDVSLIQYKGPGGNRGKIHPWVMENIELVYTRLQELKQEA